ncbi:hypothetical protein ACFJIS_04825 [Variovorax boronicumulans]|uniref:hypothetical protein n=1 Tax=Variovorax boronicumulans TaxID=436515 RepID=UPI0036F314F1
MNAQLLELHYHLRDDAHSMDAHIRNRCEAEALACFEHILQQFNIAANIETTVYTEGGLREIWRFLIKPENASAVGAVAAVTTIPISVLALLVAIWAVPSAPDPETEKINKEIAKLTLEEKERALSSSERV